MNIKLRRGHIGRRSNHGSWTTSPLGERDEESDPVCECGTQIQLGLVAMAHGYGAGNFKNDGRDPLFLQQSSQDSTSSAGEGNGSRSWSEERVAASRTRPNCSFGWFLP